MQILVLQEIYFWGVKLANQIPVKQTNQKLPSLHNEMLHHVPMNDVCYLRLPLQLPVKCA